MSDSKKKPAQFRMCKHNFPDPDYLSTTLASILLKLNHFEEHHNKRIFKDSFTKENNQKIKINRGIYFLFFKNVLYLTLLHLLFKIPLCPRMLGSKPELLRLWH
jgi:hypothetical protein